ncbi:MAG: tetratricopeptide repeat protein [Thermoplasmata archaeon]|nr:tetratricopeptide repeat protein [Thermoplasmata archaeon]
MQQDFERELTLAMNCHEKGNSRKALALMKKIREKYTEKQNLCKVSFLEATIYYDNNRWKKAAERYARAIEVCEDPAMKIRAINGIARTYWRLGKYEEAVGMLVDAAEEIAKIDDKKLAGESNINIGNIYLSMGDYRGAIRHFEMAIKILTEIGDEYQLSRAYNNIGEANKLSGNVAEAVHFYEKAQELGKKSGNIRIWGYATENLAECYAKLHNFEKAAENAEQALKYFRKMKDTMMTGVTFMAYGMIFREMKDFKRAEKYFKKCFAYLKRAEGYNDLIFTYLEYSRLLWAEEKYGSAIKVLKRAEKLAVKLNATNIIGEIRKEIKKCEMMGE